MTQTLTTERLKELADPNMICKCSWDEYKSMARELLANREAQPVGIIRHVVTGVHASLFGPLPEGTELFTAPRDPQQTVFCIDMESDFIKHIQKCSDDVAAWPEWKRRGADVTQFTTPPAPAVLDERAEFESFIAQRFGELIDRRRAENSDNDYMAWDMAVAWIVWQCRAVAG